MLPNTITIDGIEFIQRSSIPPVPVRTSVELLSEVIDRLKANGSIHPPAIASEPVDPKRDEQINKLTSPTGAPAAPSAGGDSETSEVADGDDDNQVEQVLRPARDSQPDTTLAEEAKEREISEMLAGENFVRSLEQALAKRRGGDTKKNASIQAYFKTKLRIKPEQSTPEQRRELFDAIASGNFNPNLAVIQD